MIKVIRNKNTTTLQYISTFAIAPPFFPTPELNVLYANYVKPEYTIDYAEKFKRYLNDFTSHYHNGKLDLVDFTRVMCRQMVNDTNFLYAKIKYMVKAQGNPLFFSWRLTPYSEKLSFQKKQSLLEIDIKSLYHRLHIRLIRPTIYINLSYTQI